MPGMNREEGVNAAVPEETLEALALGMLDADEAGALEARVRKDKELRRRYEAVREEALAIRSYLAAGEEVSEEAPLDEVTLALYLDGGLDEAENARVTKRLSRDRTSLARLKALYGEVQACLAGVEAPLEQADDGGGPGRSMQEEKAEAGGMERGESAPLRALPVVEERAGKRGDRREILCYAGAAACWLAALILPGVFRWSMCMAAVLLVQSGLLARGGAGSVAGAALSGFSGRAMAGAVVAFLWVGGTLMPIAAPWLFSAAIGCMAFIRTEWRGHTPDTEMETNRGRDSGEDRESPSDKTRKSARNG